QATADLPVTFDLGHLVHASVFAALAQLGGAGSSAAVDRCSQRFSIFVGAFHEDPDFRALVLEFLWRGLAFVEESCSYLAYDDCSLWLRHEAARLESVLESGTFAESAWRVLCRKATPVLAAFLSLADRHHGLDALSSGPGWRRNLWLRLARLLLTPAEGFSASTAACEALTRFAQPNAGSVAAAADEPACQLPFAAEVVPLWTTAAAPATLRPPWPGDLLLLSRASILNGDAGADVHRLVADLLERQARTDATADASSESEQPARLAAAVWAASVEWRDCLRLSAALMARADGLAASLTEAADGVRRCADLPLAALEHFQLGFSRAGMVAALTNPGHRSAWCRQVRDCGPAVENLLAKVVQLAQEAAAEARAAWQRVQCVQLFLDTVSLPFDAESSVPEGLIQPVRLWNSFLANPHASFKTVTAIRLIEAFLTQTDADIASSLTCCVCDESDEGDEGSPAHLLLACGHRLCRDCSGLPDESESDEDVELANDDADDEQAAEQDGRNSDEAEDAEEPDGSPAGASARLRCPVCQESGVAAAAPAGASFGVRAEFRARCNTFMMETVGRLTFGGGPEPPSPELCRHLVAYVTACDAGGPSETKEFAFFTQNRDPSPVFRSFILQQLLRYSRDSVQQQLTEHLASARNILGQAAAVDLARIVCHCLEDLHMAKLAKQMRPDLRLKLALSHLQTGLADQPQPDYLDGLSSLATGRAALTALADALAEDEQRLASENPDRPTTVARSHLKSCRPARVFLLRSLASRLGGGGAVRLLRQHRWLAEVFGDELEGGAAGQDNHGGASQPELLLCHSEEFRIAREAVWQLVLGMGNQAMEPRPASLGDVEPQIFVSQLLPDALSSQLGRQLLELLELQVPGQRPEVQHQLRSLLLHAAYLAAVAQPGRSSLLDFFRQLPAKASSWFLPGMPHDLMFEAVQAIRARPAEGENPTLYLCPRGHPYIITECGRPWTRGRCNVCQQQIGGAGHDADPGNQVQLDRPDQSQRGFLEDPSDRGGWRSLPAGCVAALRLL
uniref:RING-type domain-containing protein n=1 Tax=Macrostomum lignano TaxID=282301 RepID=A0A1I8GKU3_9PLAT